MDTRKPQSDRLLPCFLDRLRDDYPKATREGRSFRSVSLKQYRDSVLRDLQWLLNTGILPTHDDFAEFPRVRKSVLNFGVPSLAGLWVSSRRPESIEQAIRTAILAFEPRILPASLQVRVVQVKDESEGGNSLSLEIAGELYAEPMSERLYLRTEVDLETGQCIVNEA